MVKLSFYVPVTHVEEVKRAVFAAGAGRQGQYDSCCWQALGQGQFRPLEGSSPFLGAHGELERVDEYQVEMICDDHLVAAAISALKAAHPYEEPAYGVFPMFSF